VRVLRWDGEVIGVRHRDHTGLKYAVTRSSNDFPKSLQPATLIVISHRRNHLTLALSLTRFLSVAHPLYFYTVSLVLIISIRTSPSDAVLFDDGYKLRVWYGWVWVYYSFTEFGSPSSRARVCVYTHILYIYIEINRGGIAERIKADA